MPRIAFDVTVHFADDNPMFDLLKSLSAKISSLTQNVDIMAGELDQLVANVKAQGTVVDSTVVLIQGLNKKLDEAIAAGNPAALTTLSTEIKAQTDALTAAAVSVPVIGVPPTP